MAINKNSFVAIQAFMVNDLHLGGHELIAYAAIFGFSQDGIGWFSGSCGYLAQWCGSSKRTVSRVLKNLTHKGLIRKREKIVRGVKRCEYQAVENYTAMTKSHGSNAKMATPPDDKMARNNIVINNIDHNHTHDTVENSTCECAARGTQSEHRANDEIRVSFEKLMSASIKPVADNRRNQTYQAYCQRLKDGYSARQIAQEYETYKRYYTINHATDRYAKQLERWLTDDDGLRQALPAAKRQEQERRCAHKLAQAEQEKREAEAWQAKSNDLAKTDPIFAAKREKWKNLQKAAIFAAGDRRKSLHNEIQTLLSEMNEYLRIHSTSGFMATMLC